YLRAADERRGQPDSVADHPDLAHDVLLGGRPALLRRPDSRGLRVRPLRRGHHRDVFHDLRGGSAGGRLDELRRGPAPSGQESGGESLISVSKSVVNQWFWRHDPTRNVDRGDSEVSARG